MDSPPDRKPPGRDGRARDPVGGGPKDPYLAWARATEYRYLPGDPDRDLPLLIKLKGINAREFAAKEWAPPHTDLGWLKVPELYRNLPDELASLTFCTAEVERASVQRLWTEDFLKSVIEEFELSDPLGYIAPPLPTPGVAGSWTPSVLVGVIDDGLPFANVRFRDGNATTRVEYLWDQDRPTDLSKAALDAFLAAAQHAGLVDEDEVYRQAGYDYAVSGHKSWARRATHGAHVMDLACGLDLPVAADAPHIVGVHLPSRITADPSGGKLEAHAFGGFLYILIAAKQVANTYGKTSLPLVVNLSYGVNHGPHDGSSLFERAVDFLIALWSSIFKPVHMVLPAGNSHLTRCHVRFQLAAASGRPRVLYWRVQPDDATPSFLDIWLPGGEQVEVTVTPPGQMALPTIHAGDPPFDWGAGPLLRVEYPGTPEAGGGIRIFLALAPTTTLDPATPVAPSGTWQIAVKNVNPKPSQPWIDSWIWRDDNPFGYPIRGRQSRFEDPAYEDTRFDPKGHLSEVDTTASYIQRDGSVNGIATGSQTVVVGGCRRSDLASARYSAGGPGPASAARPGPDVTSWAEWSVACHGMLATGTRSGSIVAVNGTSVAAPQVTRWIADRMAQGKSGNRAAVAVEGALHPTPNILAKRGGTGYIPGYSPVRNR